MDKEDERIAEVLAKAKVGDKVWCLSRSHNLGWYKLKVLKVSRSHIHTDGKKLRRFRIDDGRETGDPNFPERAFGSIERRNHEYITENRYKIARLVERITSVTKLKSVAAIVGYVEKEAK